MTVLTRILTLPMTFDLLLMLCKGPLLCKQALLFVNFRFFQLIIGMINQFIQWYVDLVTFRAGNLSLGYNICRGLVRDNVCRARRSGFDGGREETMLLQGEIGSSATFLLRAKTRFGRVTTLQQSFALLNTSWGWLRCLRVTQNSSFQILNAI